MTTSDVPPETCPKCGTLVDVSQAEPLAAIDCPGCGEKIRVQPAFDNFVVVETLGAGGMGAVYKARDTRLDRMVALKVLRRELSADPTEAARLEQEARVTAAVNHPNVVQVYSTGTAHGQIYLVMELVDHGSLDDLMAQHGRLAESDVLRAGIQVAKGLQAAQAKGLIHRDVKPANILFADRETAKIGDFGLAIVAEHQAEAQHEIWGTPYYVAPERLNNEAEDFRSDIYSLGATLFHALAGKPPMEGETVSASELRQLKSHPPDLHAVAPEVSRETSKIINKMLALNPANRFTSYAHLITQLERAARMLPGDDGGTAKGAKPRWLLPAALVAIALLAGGGYLYLKSRPTPQPHAPVAAASNVEDTAALQRRYETARQELVAEKFDAAATAFAKLAQEAHSQPLLNWVRLHAGLAEILRGKPTPAREQFQQIERAGVYSTAKADAPLANFFVETARKLAAPAMVRGDALGKIDPKSADAFALFLCGLKGWQASDFDEASALLERFMSSEPAGAFAWIAEYKPLARKFLDDRRVYTEWKATPLRTGSTAELRTALETTKTAQSKLQMRGALADELNNQARRLASELDLREKTENIAREKERERLLGAESPVWEAALAEAHKRIGTYDFSGALAAINGAKLTETSLVEAQTAERKKAVWLVEWKTRLLADLRSGTFRGAVTVGVTTYQGAATASEAEITLRIPPYGSAPFAWTKFPLATLLSMSTAFIRAGAADAADRAWLSAVFASATGQQEAARALAEAAAKGRSEYGAEIPLLLPPNG
ncbi:MAG: serine/threonine-protein kinase [Chthoniobacterales bacterium]